MGASCHVPAFEQSTQHLLRKIISQCQDASILYIYYTCTVCMYVCMYVYIHTYIHACMHACMHAYIHTYIHTHTHIYIYIERFA